MTEPGRRLTRRTRPAPPLIDTADATPRLGRSKIPVAGHPDPFLAQLYGRADEICRHLREILHLADRTDPQGPDNTTEAAKVIVKIAEKFAHIAALAIPAGAVLIWRRITGAH